MKTSIAEWGTPPVNLIQEKPMHPILEAYVSGKTCAKTVDLYRLLQKLKVTK